jgi:hypothetical protein
LGGYYLRKETSELLAYHLILKLQPNIADNPFEHVPQEALEEALNLLKSIEVELAY